MASCDPADERERDSEDNEHHSGAGSVEAFVPQKDGKGAGIKDEATNKDAMAGKRLGAIYRVCHFDLLDALQSASGFKPI